MNEKGNSFPNFHLLEELVKKGLISYKTMDKVKIGTSVLERKYLSKESVYNKHQNLYNKINIYLNSIPNLSEQEKEDIKNSIFKKISKYNRLLRQKLTEKRFETISIIGDGSLGKVKLVRDKLNNKIYAMKKLSINAILRNSQLFHIKIERDILSMNTNNVWQTKLNYSFIDGDYLYYIIDYCPGGDLYGYLRREPKKDTLTTLTEDEAKFYIAEIILGVDNLHKNNCIHRDIKPENILIDKLGHLKIGDFGLSILSNNFIYPYTYKWINSNDQIYCEKDDINNKENNTKKIIGFTKLGTLCYIAPEVLEKKCYGEEIDWWSVGIVFYEMLIGYTPFFDELEEEIIKKVINFKKYLKIPKEANLSKDAQKLILDFLEYKDKRLGKGGIEEIKEHPFFKGFDWDNIRKIKPPFVPKPFRIQNLDLKINLKNNRLGLYTSKEMQNRGYNKLKHFLVKMNLNIYDFYYNKELDELKYNLDNNITELIKKQIKNYSKKKVESKNILDELSTEDFLTMPSVESCKKIVRYMNKSTNIYNSEVKSNYPFFDFEKIDKDENKILKKKKAIQIIPIRNLIFNNCKNINYNNKKELLYNSIRSGTPIKNDLKMNNFSVNKNKKYLMTERKYMSKSIFKDNNINNINNNTEMKILNKSKTKDNHYKKEKLITNIKAYNDHNEDNKIINIENDKRKMKINGKLFMIKKNLGKYY